MAAQGEENSIIKNKRKSNEERGLVTIEAHFGMKLKFAIKDGKLYWCRKKQSLTMNDFQMIPGYDIVDFAVKTFYTKGEVEKENKDEQISIDIVKRVDNGLATMFQTENLFSKLLMQIQEGVNVKTANESIYNSYNVYLDRLFEASLSKGNEGQGSIVKGISCEPLDYDHPDKVYYLVCEYVTKSDTYNIIQLYDAEDKVFSIYKYTEIPASEINFRTADEAEREFKEAVMNSENNIFGGTTENAINAFITHAVTSYNTINDGVEESVIKKSTTTTNDEDFETDDIYGSSPIESAKQIFKLKKPVVIEIMSDSFKFQKDVELGGIYDDKNDVIEYVISSADLANTLIESLEARQTRISINGNTKCRPTQAIGFLKEVVPCVGFKMQLGKSNDIRRTVKRISSVINPWSDYNQSIKNKFKNK